jgi:hypothetical protein
LLKISFITILVKIGICQIHFLLAFEKKVWFEHWEKRNNVCSIADVDMPEAATQVTQFSLQHGVNTYTFFVFLGQSQFLRVACYATEVEIYI